MSQSELALTNKRSPLPWLVLALALVALAIPLRGLLGQEAQVKSWLALAGPAAPAVFVAATAVLTALGMPRLLFCSVAGLVFGFAWGLAWGQLGTLLGAYCTFLFARWNGRAYILGRFPQLAAWSAPIGRRGWLAVLLLRQLPVNGLSNDIVLGISPISHLDFWVGSALGFLPLGVAATLAGAGVEQAEWGRIAREFLARLSGA